MKRASIGGLTAAALLATLGAAQEGEPEAQRAEDASLAAEKEIDAATAPPPPGSSR